MNPSSVEPTDTIWWHVSHPASADVAERTVHALRGAQFRLVPKDDAGTARAGIVFTPDTSGDLETFVSSASQAGKERLLLVRTSPTGFDSGMEWRLLGSGASDILRWRGLESTMRDVVSRLERWRRIDELVASPVVAKNLLGVSPAWIRAIRRVVEVGHFTEASALLQGETGTGKELAARLIHTLDGRRDRGDLIIVDCGNIVPSLSGSELFGHERGAFTGAVSSREGAFGLADNGTLFLDEVADLPLDLQSQLLRVIQERKYKRVGGNTWHNTRFRLVCATHIDLRDRVARGLFRADLFHRIGAAICRLPALRDRGADVLHLARHFIRERLGRSEDPELDPPVERYFRSRDYPGNIRELRQLTFRMADRHVGDGPISVGDVPEDERPQGCDRSADWRRQGLDDSIRAAVGQGIPLREIGKEAADLAVEIALEEEGGNVHKAAARLGITDRALQMRLARGRPEKEESVA